MENDILIRKKIEGRLSEQELATFSKMMEDDRFKEIYEEHLTMHKVIKSAEAKNLKNHLQHLEQEKPKGTLKRLYFPIAAAILVLLTLSIFIFSQRETNEALYASNFEVYPNTYRPVVRGDTLATAFSYYEAKEYSKASIAFEKELETEEDVNVRFFYAMSLLNDSKSQEAIQVLNTLQSSETIYLQQVYWYSALIHLKMNRKKEAIKALETLLKYPETYNKKQAEALKLSLE